MNTDPQWKLEGDLIEALCNVESGLTDREVEFVENIADLHQRRGHYLTPKQLKWAEQIAERLGV